MRHKLTLRDLSEMFALRGIVFCHETVRAWESPVRPMTAPKRPTGRSSNCHFAGSCVEVILVALMVE